ncbi:heme-binding protein [Streptomyces sp. NBC_00035]|uniref:heme-binding protein n=1 Tax=Streptomyces sp. NBC_00035 TaxID=2903614 RepID=UPI00324328DD
MSRPNPTYTLEEIQKEPDRDFPRFVRDDATRLGEITVGIILEWGVNLCVDVHIGDELAYRAQLGTTGQFNADVIRRKILTVNKFGHSSLLARLKRDADPGFGSELPEEYVVAGGSIPIFVDGVMTATISASGEEDALDHEVIAEALDRFAAERN